MKKLLCIVALVNILLYFSPGSALVCHICQSEMGKDLACDSNPENVPHVLCAADFLCVKIMWINETTTTITRSCGAREVCQSLPADEIDVTYCSTCDADLCN